MARRLGGGTPPAWPGETPGATPTGTASFATRISSRAPAATVQEVTTFLGEEYEPDMLAMRDAPTYRRKLAGGQDPPADVVPISAEHIGAYRDRVPPVRSFSSNPCSNGRCARSGTCRAASR